MSKEYLEKKQLEYQMAYGIKLDITAILMIEIIAKKLKDESSGEIKIFDNAVEYHKEIKKQNHGQKIIQIESIENKLLYLFNKYGLNGILFISLLISNIIFISSCNKYNRAFAMLEDINNKRSSYIIDTIFLNKEKMRIKEEKQIIKRNKNTNEYLLEFFKYMENEGDPEITKQYLETHSFH